MFTSVLAWILHPCMYALLFLFYMWVCLCVYVGGQDGMFVISNSEEAVFNSNQGQELREVQFCSYQICYLNLSSEDIFCGGKLFSQIFFIVLIGILLCSMSLIPAALSMILLHASQHRK